MQNETVHCFVFPEPSLTPLSPGKEPKCDTHLSLSLCREPSGLSVFSDEETDLIRELQTMCSSKSEPDISKVTDVVTVVPVWSPSGEAGEGGGGGCWWVVATSRGQNLSPDEADH